MCRCHADKHGEWNDYCGRMSKCQRLWERRVQSKVEYVKGQPEQMPDPLIDCWPDTRRISNSLSADDDPHARTHALSLSITHTHTRARVPKR